MISIRHPNGSIKKSWLYSGLFSIWLLWISGIFGNSGVMQAYKLSDTRYELSMRIKALEAEKTKLANSQRALDRDKFAQETAVRENLGFVRENELIFEFH